MSERMVENPIKTPHQKINGPQLSGQTGTLGAHRYRLGRGISDVPEGVLGLVLLMIYLNQSGRKTCAINTMGAGGSTDRKS